MKKSVEIGSPDRRIAATPLLLSLFSVVLILNSVGLGAKEPRNIRIIETNVQTGSAYPVSRGEGAKGNALSFESAEFRTTLSDGDSYRGFLFSLYDRETGLYWWSVGSFASTGPEVHLDFFTSFKALFLSDKEILVVALLSPPINLWIRHSDLRVKSAEEGRLRAIESIENSIEKIEQGTIHGYREITIEKALPEWFFRDPEHPNPPLEARVTAIERVPSGWVLSLNGRVGRRAKVELSDLLLLKSATLIDE